MAQSCPHCGTELEPEDEFCTGCLADFGPPPEPQVGRTATEQAELIGDSLSLVVSVALFGPLLVFGAYTACTGLASADVLNTAGGGFCVALSAVFLRNSVKSFRKTLRSEGSDTPQ